MRFDIDTSDGFTLPPVTRDEQGQESFCIADKVSAELALGSEGRAFGPGDLVTFFIQQVDGIAVGIIANYIFSLLQARKAKEIIVNQSVTITARHTVQQIIVIIERERNDRG